MAVRPVNIIVTPHGFDNAPNGSIVSEPIYFGLLRYPCDLEAGEEIGLRVAQGHGLKVVEGVNLKSFNYWDAGYASVVYTTQELESRGLGYVVSESGGAGGIGWMHYCSVSNSTRWVYLWIRGNPGQFGDIVGGQEPKTIFGSSCPSGSGYPYKNTLVGSFDVRLVKIGNASSQHAALPQNFTAPLVEFVYYYTSNPSVPIASIAASVNFVDFASRVRTGTCATPTASESIINFGHVSQQQVEAAGLHQTITQKEFTLTFSCSGAWAYGRDVSNTNRGLSFFFEPMYGVVDYSNAIMKIAQGPGMARGVGVRMGIFSYNSEYNDWAVNHTVVYRTDPADDAGCTYFACGKIGIYEFFSNPENPQPASANLVISLRAFLVRTNEPVVAGQIKAAALIHIRYN